MTTNRLEVAFVSARRLSFAKDVVKMCARGACQDSYPLHAFRSRLIALVPAGRLVKVFCTSRFSL